MTREITREQNDAIEALTEEHGNCRVTRVTYAGELRCLVDCEDSNSYTVDENGTVKWAGAGLKDRLWEEVR